MKEDYETERDPKDKEPEEEYEERMEKGDLPETDRDKPARELL